MHQLIFENTHVMVGRKVVLQDINLSIAKGKIVAVIGNSGSGKTTFLQLILDLLFPNKGWNITNSFLGFPGLKMAYIHQNPTLQVFKNFVYEEFATLSKAAAAIFLEKHGFIHLLHKRCLELSQGEKTIVAILRALSLQVDLIALDEVIVNLSLSKRQWLEKALLDFKDAGGTVIIADHCKSILKFAEDFLLVENNTVTLIDKNRAEAFFAPSLEQSTLYEFKSVISNSQQLVVQSIIDRQIASSLKQPISFVATSGEIIGISGDNGSGKSTLLEIIGGIKKPNDGVIKWNQKELPGLRSRRPLLSLCTAYNVQHFLARTVAEELNMAVTINNRELMHTVIVTFGLEALSQYPIAALSYGAKQRLAVALTMLADKPVLVFDEPTYGMDKCASNAFIKSLRLLADTGRIILVASHDYDLLTVLSENHAKIISL